VEFQGQLLSLDFHVFDIPESMLLIGMPVFHLVKSASETFDFTVGNTFYPIDYRISKNSRIDSKVDVNLLEEVLSAELSEVLQPTEFDGMPKDFIEEEHEDEFSELDKNEPVATPAIEPLPSGLKYAFLHDDHKSPIIISDQLTNDEASQLVAVLEKYQSVIGYSLADLKGINPSYCTHRIPMEPEHKPAREHQRRLNNAMREVVKKEILKLLNAGIIYPVQDSEWVSPVQVVPKKGGMTVIQNEKNELIPQRTVTGW
jgi:hypothetical protein